MKIDFNAIIAQCLNGFFFGIGVVLAVVLLKHLGVAVF